MCRRIPTDAVNVAELNFLASNAMLNLARFFSNSLLFLHVVVICARSARKLQLSLNWMSLVVHEAPHLFSSSAKTKVNRLCQIFRGNHCIPTFPRLTPKDTFFMFCFLFMNWFIAHCLFFIHIFLSVITVWFPKYLRSFQHWSVPCS